LSSLRGDQTQCIYSTKCAPPQVPPTYPKILSAAATGPHIYLRLVHRYGRSWVLTMASSRYLDELGSPPHPIHDNRGMCVSPEIAPRQVAIHDFLTPSASISVQCPLHNYHQAPCCRSRQENYTLSIPSHNHGPQVCIAYLLHWILRVMQRPWTFLSHCACETLAYPVPGLGEEVGL
jgi:hypothetical protein